MDQPIVLVHLSDIHFHAAERGAEARNASLRIDVVNDLRGERERRGNATAVVVTGDIAYSADPAEYAVARGWLDEVAAAVGVDRAHVLTVPGNHDVHWPSIGQASKEMRQKLRRCDEDEINHLLDRLHDDPAKTLLSPLTNYNDFAVGYGCQISDNGDPWQVEHPLPAGYRLAIRGLTTVWNSDRDDTRGSLVVGGTQMTLKDDDPRRVYLLLGHHGPEECRDGVRIRDRARDRAVAYLSGHRHEQRINRVENWLELVAGAVNPEEAHGWNPMYNWIEFTADAGDATLPAYLQITVCPRVFRPDTNRFVADTVNGTDCRVERLPLRRLPATADAVAVAAQADPIGASLATEKADTRTKGIETTDGAPVSGVGDSDPVDLRPPLLDEEGHVDTERRLIRDLLDLTYLKQMRVLSLCGLLTDADRDKSFVQMLTDAVDLARDTGRLQELAAAIRAEHDDRGKP